MNNVSNSEDSLHSIPLPADVVSPHLIAVYSSYWNAQLISFLEDLGDQFSKTNSVLEILIIKCSESFHDSNCLTQLQHRFRKISWHILDISILSNDGLDSLINSRNITSLCMV